MIFTLTIATTMITGCSGGSSSNDSTKDPLITPTPGTDIPVDGDKGKTVSLAPTDGSSNNIVASFMTSDTEGVGIIDVSNLTFPLQLQHNDISADLSMTGFILPKDRGRFNELLPHPNVFCDNQNNDQFNEVAEKLGGFNKTSSIEIEDDAAAPTIMDGLGAPFAVAESVRSDVTIQRPDVIGKQGNRAVYLSDIYGLIMVNFTNSNDIKVSCGSPLPGIPENFVFTDKYLMVLTSSRDRRDSAILQFDITGDSPVFNDAIYIEDSGILDARLFNNSLALYIETYEPMPAIDEPAPMAESDNQSISPISSASVVAMDMSLPYYGQQVIAHELRVIETEPLLSLVYSNVFIDEETDEDPDKVEHDRLYSRFNNFLSASGEYLVVTESVSHSVFSHYETKHYNRCTDREKLETPYHYCSTNWKRVENPDYQPLPNSGILNCNSDLLSCLKVELPKVSRYVRIADGETCYSGTRVRYQCNSYSRESYDVAKYDTDRYTKFNVFRFNNGEFTLLDDTLATLTDQTISDSDQPFRLEGKVQKHDHLHFQGDQFYAVMDKGRTDDNPVYELVTLSIIGNSAILSNRLELESSKNSEINTSFTEDNIYISDSSYQWNSQFQWSELQTINITNPLKPTTTENTRIPTRLDQLFFDDETLLGIGKATVDHGFATSSVGSLTSFDIDGVETNNLLLGADYQYYSSQISYDDQVLNYDAELNRMFVPYSVRIPVSEVNAPLSQNRLAMARLESGMLIDEFTFTLPKAPERTVSAEEDLAFAFSSEYIHSLSFDEEWLMEAVFDAPIPTSIYYTQAYETQTQKFVTGSNYTFKLINSPDKASGDLLDSVSAPRASSSFCLTEKVYFDTDRILVVKEKPGLYFSYQDCPSYKFYNEAADEELQSNEPPRPEMVLTGYLIGKSALSVIDDQTELQTLYDQIQLNLVCVTDNTNPEGTSITSEALIESDEMKTNLICYTQKGYRELI
jgi:hypothetical protein